MKENINSKDIPVYTVFEQARMWIDAGFYGEAEVRGLVKTFDANKLAVAVEVKKHD